MARGAHTRAHRCPSWKRCSCQAHRHAGSSHPNPPPCALAHDCLPAVWLLCLSTCQLLHYTLARLPVPGRQSDSSACSFAASAAVQLCGFAALHSELCCSVALLLCCSVAPLLCGSAALLLLCCYSVAALMLSFFACAPKAWRIDGIGGLGPSG